MAPKLRPFHLATPWTGGSRSPNPITCATEASESTQATTSLLPKLWCQGEEKLTNGTMVYLDQRASNLPYGPLNYPFLQGE